MKTKATISYCYCNICGYTPKTEKDCCNFVRKFWDCDDGWKIGALCVGCWLDVKNDAPKKGDYAHDTNNEFNLDNINTDEDPTMFL